MTGMNSNFHEVSPQRKKTKHLWSHRFTVKQKRQIQK